MKHAKGLIVICATLTFAAFAVQLSTAQVNLNQRPPKLSTVANSKFVALAIGSKTIRIDSNTGASSWLFFDQGTNTWAWKALNEAGTAPVAGTDRYQLLQGGSGGSDFLRLDRSSGKTWVLVTKSLLPEWQVLTNN